MKTCSAKNCSRPYEAKGYCSKHYYQFRKYGRILKSSMQDFNEVVDKGSHYELILTDIKMNEKGRCKIDKEDLNKINGNRWGLHNEGYVVRGNKLIHRIIMDASEQEIVDHVKTGFIHRSDNRKKNLRKCTYTQNNHNMNKRSDNTSGFKGVSWSKSKNKFRAYISVGGKFKHLGYFETAEEASKAYKKAAKALHKEFYLDT